MQIPGYSRYDIDEQANVVDTVTGKTIPVSKSGQYTSVRVLPDGKKTKQQKNLHVLMCVTYHGARPDDTAVVRFIDGDTANITPGNLEWATRSAIARSAWHDNKASRKPKRSNCFNEDTIPMVYDALKTFDEPVTMSRLAEELLVPYTLIRYTMYGLIAAGKAKAVEGGYVASGDD